MAAPRRWAFILARQGEAWASGACYVFQLQETPLAAASQPAGPLVLMWASGCGGQNEVWCGGGKGVGLSESWWARSLSRSGHKCSRKHSGHPGSKALRWNIEESNFQVPSLSESISLDVQWVALLWWGLEITLVNQYGTPRLFAFVLGRGSRQPRHPRSAVHSTVPTGSRGGCDSGLPTSRLASNRNSNWGLGDFFERH